MKYLIRLICIAALLVPCAAGRAGDLPTDVNTLLGDKLLKRAVVGVEIIRLGANAKDDRPVFQKDQLVQLIPASNLKLLTTSAALQKLGPDFKYRTTLVAGPDGDLAILGAGDPTLGDLELLKPVGWTITTVFESWADQLAKRNIASVRDVVIDDSVFDESFWHPNWPIDQAELHYAAQVGGLNLNANVLQFVVRPGQVGELVSYATNPPDTRYVSVRNTCVTGNRNLISLLRQNGTNEIQLRGETPSRGPATVEVTIHDPPMYAGTVFAEVLKRKGIAVTGSVRRDRTVATKNWRALAIHETPITTVLKRANTNSINLYAESLCKRLGHEASKQPGSWENGTAASAAFLKSLGVDEAEFKLDDGCGLSKQNRISADALARILTFNFHSANREVFRTSLGVAGVDGTMENRFRGTDLKGRVFAKSGFVNGVRALSGYLHTRDDQWYAFSILMNKVPETPEIKSIQDKIVKSIDSHAAELADGR